MDYKFSTIHYTYDTAEIAWIFQAFFIYDIHVICQILKVYNVFTLVHTF